MLGKTTIFQKKIPRKASLDFFGRENSKSLTIIPEHHGFFLEKQKQNPKSGLDIIQPQDSGRIEKLIRTITDKISISEELQNQDMRSKHCKN